MEGCLGPDRTPFRRRLHGVRRALGAGKAVDAAVAALEADLQRLKAECGYGGHDAVEVFPHALDVINVANMRHLWVMGEPLTFAWRRG